MKKLNKTLFSVLAVILVVNQLMIGTVSAKVGKGSGMRMITFLSGAKIASAMIMMPIPDENGRLTTIKEMPTITEVAGEPNSGDVVADAMAVMIATGTPFYAPEGINFDEAVDALSAWGKYANMSLSSELDARYKKLIGVFPCNFCCGSPTNVTINGRCGCAHANAARGFFKYMLSNYAGDYTDEQLIGEAYRWQAIWYPSGVVEDYLLATGRGDVIGHKTHGGAGKDGYHGM